jgi:SAM-dependent methyltransferase
MPVMTPAELDDFVHAADGPAAGNLGHRSLSHFYPIELAYSTFVDQEADPFSDAYFQQQLALYKEISGRNLNQWDGEIHHVDIAPLIDAPNPLGNKDPMHVAEHVRAISAMLSICSLHDSAAVLDMGAGHGLSSELLAFCGCKVHAIDIDAGLGELSAIRSKIRKLDIRRATLNFDDLGTIPAQTYAAAFFFQSLHHCLRPWELIASIRSKLLDGGVIAFTGEPIQSAWWKHWGLRLDEESLYVARKWGWFESGWSHDFIRLCFERNGMSLHLFSGGHAGGEIGIASARPMDNLIERAEQLGHRIVEQPKNYLSQIGLPTLVHGHRGFRSPEGGSGFLSYGPYISLRPGRYRVSFALEGAAQLDVVANLGKLSLIGAHPVTSGWVVKHFEVQKEASNVEARLFVDGGAACSYPQIEPLP